ncbi:hypothetical protein [Nocardia bovistercoris]|uniref:Uncharacterized protein n=1 Tax=Nocardia bovistercoris TaxID=2785916 RepID=A0A931IC77_9NOCA|nr:hypothetical protein [Nocardia bovistercoris]MBH0778739.1 hypothetical protein [Nocardia bovistercoris]
MITEFLTDPVHPSEVAGWLWARWPWVVLATGVSLLVSTGVSGCARGWRAREARGAVWLDVSVPATVTAEAGAVFARRLAGGLHRTRRVGIGARHLALEFVATGAGTRVGVWIPPRENPAPIAAAIRDAWPGATVTTTTPPALAGRVTAVEITARNGAWATWTDPRPATRAGTGGRGGAVVSDPLAAVLEGLADHSTGHTGFTQLVLTPYHRRTVTRFLGKALLFGASEILAMARMLLRDNGTRAVPVRSAVPPSAVREAGERAQRVKMATAPHFSATLRVGLVSRARVAGGRVLVSAVAGGFDAIADSPDTGGLRTRRVRDRYRVSARRPGRGFVATVAEVAALWHLPADAARFAIPVVRARTRTARPSVPRLHHPAIPAAPAEVAISDPAPTGPVASGPVGAGQPGAHLSLPDFVRRPVRGRSPRPVRRTFFPTDFRPRP